MTTLTIYASGKAAGNKSAFGHQNIYSHEVKVTRCFSYKASTDNEINLVAAIEALRYVNPEDVEKVIFYHDSDYVRLGITRWISGWIRPQNGNKAWTTSRGEPVKHIQEWTTLYQLVQSFQIEWRWLKDRNNEGYHPEADEQIIGARKEILEKIAEKLQPTGADNN